MRIGLVLNILDEQYQISIYEGIKNRVKELGIELICMQEEFACVTSNLFSKSDHKLNFFNLDGIILLTSVIADSYIINTKADVTKIFGDIPVVSAGEKVEGIPSVMIQTDDSMKQLVEHLILHHNYKNFVYIGGSPKHHDSNFREDIFIKTIEAYKPWYPELNYVIKYGLFSEHDAIQAMKDYYQENPNANPDVIVCASDNMAIGIYKFYNMNQDNPLIKPCAVTGFDDIRQAKYIIPALTTIKQPLKEIGEKAVNQIVKLIEKKDVEDEIYIESKFVIRNSCGCSESIEEWKEPSKFVENLQKNYVKLEILLRTVSRIAQELNYNEELIGLKYVINKNMEEMGIRDFCILKYVDKKEFIKPIYVRRNGINFLEFAGDKKMTITDFYEKYIYYDKDIPSSLILKVLQTNNESLGFVIYDAPETELPYLWTISTNISQALMKIDVIEERKRYSDFLEQEVKKRTKELILADNKRLDVEAQVLKISEMERQRFSTDLHDDICQRLAGISMLCRSYSKQDAVVKKEDMVELTELISDTLQTTRQYAHNSYPVEIESLGLNHSLNNLCNTYEKQSGIKCEYNWLIEEDYKFSKIQQINIFRIIQEALHNVSKHAKANNALVEIKYDKKKIVISIIDDGIGFNSRVSKKGLGLNSMQYRANQIGAKFQMKKNKPKGTVVLLQLSKENIE